MGGWPLDRGTPDHIWAKQAAAHEAYRARQDELVHAAYTRIAGAFPGAEIAVGIDPDSDRLFRLVIFGCTQRDIHLRVRVSCKNPDHTYVDLFDESGQFASVARSLLTGSFSILPDDLYSRAAWALHHAGAPEGCGSDIRSSPGAAPWCLPGLRRGPGRGMRIGSIGSSRQPARDFPFSAFSFDGYSLVQAQALKFWRNGPAHLPDLRPATSAGPKAQTGSRNFSQGEPELP